MKNILIYIILGLSVAGFAGCQEDFLERNPLDRISSSTFWKSKGDFDMALTAIYGSMQGGGGIFSYETPNWDVLTDNGYGQHNYKGSKAIVQGDISPSSGGYITDLYNTAYSSIARINIFLQQLAAYEGADMDAATKALYEAEARFFRGFYYFQLYSGYGAVPLVLEPLTLENQVQPKAPAEEVLNQVYTDLDFSAANLPDVPYVENAGHVVKSAAQALKLRVLMFTAYNENGSPDNTVLTQARDLALEIMGAGYDLSDNFTDVFKDGTQEDNPEIIYSVKFLAPDNATSMDQWYGDWLVVSPLQNLVDAFEPNDSRLGITIFKDAVDFGGPVHNPSNNAPTSYGVKKFLTPGLIPYGYSTQSQQDWVLLRYADVLLMYAEAQNELAGPDLSVREAVNSVRARAGLPALSASLDKVQMREAIRHERRVELAFEGLRFYDLKRWRIAGEVLNNVSDGLLDYNFEERFYRWPIPQAEIDKSQGQLEQNPDYQ